MTRMRLLLPLVAGLLLVPAAACAKAAGDQPGDTGSTGSYAADAAVIQATYVGGFVPAEHNVTRLPLVAVYGDGRVITEGPQIAIYPGPALPNVLVQKISPKDVDKLVKKALDAGVGTATDFGQPPIADAPSTKFRVLSASGEKVTEVYALGEADGNGLTEAQVKARQKLKKLLDDLTNLKATLGEDAVGKEEPFRPAALAAVARPWQADASGVGPQPDVAWPGPQLPGKPIGQLDMGCVTVTGDALTATLKAAEKANAITPWTSGGKKWLISFRPLLPDEAGCDDLA
ncbi:MAG: hypothetical protein HOV79_32875 [Hamadaea sp.]|nr:hypothetical protein [Hamadaea sp.]